MRLYVLALLLAGLLGYVQSQCSSPATLPPQCHYNCSVLVCGSSTPTATSTLRISQCSDPLALTLTVELSGVQFTQEYQVGGPQEVTTCNDHGSIQLHSVFSRNTTHLLIQVLGLYEGDIAFTVVPSVSLPLTPHSCMCQSMEAVAASFSLDIPLFPLQYNCSRSKDCSSVLCTISNNPVSLTFDPCLESITVFGLSSTSGQSVVAVFNETEDRTFTQGDRSVAIHVNLTNHNFSMDFSATLSPSTIPLELQVFPLNKVILDRSSCGSGLAYYPALPTPVSVCTSGGTLPGDSQAPTSPSTIPQVSTIAIAVSVPLLVVMSLVIVVTVVICVGVTLKRHKRNTNVYSFSQLAEDDDYEVAT